MVQEQLVFMVMVVLEKNLACCRCLAAAFQGLWNLPLFQVAWVCQFAKLKISEIVQVGTRMSMNPITRVVTHQ
jgi:hypothetical protein